MKKTAKQDTWFILLNDLCAKKKDVSKAKKKNALLAYCHFENKCQKINDYASFT